jgi:protein PhnA
MTMALMFMTRRAANGSARTLKRGTVVKAIRLTANPEEIDCRAGSIRGVALRAEFVTKR